MASIIGTPASDTLVGDAADDYINGGPGDDRLTGGSGRDTLLGGDGDDIISGHVAAAVIDGGEGADRISLRPLGAGETFAAGSVFLGGAGNDDFSLEWNAALTDGLAIDGGDGVDKLVIFGVRPNDPPGAPVAVHLDGEQNPGTLTLRGFESVELGTFAANVYGTDGAETISTGNRADYVEGGGGSDVISSDPVSYSIGGQPVYSGANDSLYGGAGDDTIGDSAGLNYIRGEEGNDSLQGGIGFDDLHGNMGNDTVSGGDGDDWTVGGKDQDVLSGGRGNDIVYGNLGDDTCAGDTGADLVRGGQGNDIVDGGSGDDFLAGDLGSDTVTGGLGADIFHTHALAGLDRVTDFNASEGDRVGLSAGVTYNAFQDGADTIVDMGGGSRMVLVGVTLTSLPGGWIFELS